MYTVPARPTGGTNGPFPVAPCKDGRPPVHECKTGTGSDCCLNGSPPPPSRTTDTDRLQREGPSLGQEPVFGGAVGGWGPAIGTTATEITKEVDYGDGVKLSFHVQCPDVNDHSKGFVTVSRVSTTPEEARPWTFRFPDYKGRPIRVPDVKLVGWWKSRVVSAWAIEREDGGRGDPEAAESVQNTVVYGTKTDRYAEMPEKHGTLSRRSVPDRMPEEKKEDYQRRLDENNPLRKLPKPKNPIKKAIHQIKVKGTSTKFLGVSKTEEEVQDRWNEIFEVSRQRVKHSHHGATQFVMLNSFLNTAEEFVRMYMVGSQGSDGVQHPTALNSEHEEIEGSGHVTDHELYSIFAGKHRKDILDRALFGNRETEVTDPDKVSRTGNPFLAMVTRKKFKNQIARKWHIVNN